MLWIKVIDFSVPVVYNIQLQLARKILASHWDSVLTDVQDLMTWILFFIPIRSLALGINHYKIPMQYPLDLLNCMPHCAGAIAL